MKYLCRLLARFFFRDIAEINLKLDTINMKVSEIKAAVAEASKNATEAFGEISQLLADQKAKIEELIAGLSDPDVSDAEFAANLQNVSDINKKLADIVPPVVEPPAEPPTA